MLELNERLNKVRTGVPQPFRCRGTYSFLKSSQVRGDCQRNIDGRHAIPTSNWTAVIVCDLA